MFYYLSQLSDWMALHGHPAWADALSGLRVFQYITFRAAGAAVTALLLSLWLGPRVIEWLRSLRVRQEYEDRAREMGGITADGISKRGVPTMGGLLIVGVIDITALLWAQWNPLVTLTLGAMLVLCLLGFYDDYSKITKQQSGGVRATVKLVVQFGLALFVGIFLWYLPVNSEVFLGGSQQGKVETHNLISSIMVPFAKHPVLTGVGVLGVLLTILTIVGSSNAVNLTDGLDGLAIGSTAIVATVLLVFTYLAGHREQSAYLNMPHVPGAGDLSVVCAAMIGASFGFLWFNCHPAQVFMGDTGSLALGGALGIIAVLIHQPFVLLIAGGVFVLEALSVLLQRGWFKYTRLRTGEGRRIFLMSPLHHHFQKLHWHENQVVIRFYIMGVFFAVLALATLKLR